MCNNMLQYGHAYAWGREHGRSTMSMRFAYKYQYFHICRTRWHWFWVYATAKFAANIGVLPVITFPFEKGQDTSAQEAAMLRHRNAVVEGWRVEFHDLFLKYRDEITRLFAFNDDIRRKVAATLAKAETTVDNTIEPAQKKCPTVPPSDKSAIRLGIHIRRGDYRTFQGGRFFYDDDVYAAYIREFARSHSNVHVYICGNDPHLNRQYYIEQLPGVSVHFPDGNPGEDLCLLSECDYLIGPPSTFSLVAAMYRDIPLLWMHTNHASCVNDAEAWGKFNRLFREII